MNTANTDTLESIVTTAGMSAGFDVAVGGEAVVLITGTKMVDGFPVLFTAYAEEAFGGSLNFKAHAMDAHGEQTVLNTPAELQAWVRANR